MPNNKYREKALAVITHIQKKLYNFLVGLFNHAEALAILLAASVGLNVLLSELPFLFALPMWIEGMLIIPFLAAVGILILSWSAAFRKKHNLQFRLIP